MTNKKSYMGFPFQRAVDEMRALPLSPPKGSSKSEFVVFYIKFNFIWMKSPSFLRKKSSGKVVVHSFPYLTVHSTVHESKSRMSSFCCGRISLHWQQAYYFGLGYPKNGTPLSVVGDPSLQSVQWLVRPAGLPVTLYANLITSDGRVETACFPSGSFSYRLPCQYYGSSNPQSLPN